MTQRSCECAMQHCVFVYGTLRRGGDNHHWIRGARCLGVWRTPPRFRMLDLGPYPGVIVPGDRSIVGEVYRVSANTLRALDRLEDVPRTYLRQRLDTPWGEAWIYLFRARGRRGPLVSEGDWLRHRPVAKTARGPATPGRRSG